MRILDVHTHRQPAEPSAIRSVLPSEYPSAQATYYAVGIHPWHIDSDYAAAWTLLEQLVHKPNVLAIGETGLDKAIHLPMDRQEDIFRRHIRLAMQVRKPVIVHCVRAFAELIRIKREEHADIPFIIHGFRGNATLGRQLLAQGFYLSFGQYYNEAALSDTPANRIFLETDESDTPIEMLYESAAKLRQTTVAALVAQVQTNVQQVFFWGQLHSFVWL